MSNSGVGVSSRANVVFRPKPRKDSELSDVNDGVRDIDDDDEEGDEQDEEGWWERERGVRRRQNLIKDAVNQAISSEDDSDEDIKNPTSPGSAPSAQNSPIHTLAVPAIPQALKGGSSPEDESRPIRVLAPRNAFTPQDSDKGTWSPARPIRVGMKKVTVEERGSPGATPKRSIPSPHQSARALQNRDTNARLVELAIENMCNSTRSQQPTRPEQHYQLQLNALASTGFTDTDLNSRLLEEHNGNVQVVLNLLLRQHVQHVLGGATAGGPGSPRLPGELLMEAASGQVTVASERGGVGGGGGHAEVKLGTPPSRGRGVGAGAGAAGVGSQRVSPTQRIDTIRHSNDRLTLSPQLGPPRNAAAAGGGQDDDL